ncbi:MAG: hypothetical protein HOH42_13205 [Ilumatobacter sp.]|uniref:hypothetical protein n=1 Tax=Ilumatobacter sp. TaxID=1967498 RepID=UPI0037517B64|nr:hypothetical protein [Ilumatobacter sp.]
MPASVIFPSDSPNGAEMADALANCRVIFFAGLPGAGKSLFVREQAVLADRAGKRVHFLRWDAVRPTFETDAVLQRYPDTDGVTHPLIRSSARLPVAGRVRPSPDGRPSTRGPTTC